MKTPEHAAVFGEVARLHAQDGWNSCGNAPQVFFAARSPPSAYALMGRQGRLWKIGCNSTAFLAAHGARLVEKVKKVGAQKCASNIYKAKCLRGPP